MQEIRGYYLLITQTFKSMKAPKIICTLAALAFSIAASQAVETDPVGFVSVTVPANSDAVLAVPLNRASEFKGVISSISGNIITVSGTPSWTVNQFVQTLPTQNKTYAVQIASGTKEGMIGKVTANGTNTLTLQFEPGDSLTGVVFGAAGDQIDLMPYWTPSSLMPSVPAATEIFSFSGLPVGVNYGTNTIFGFTGTNWEDGDTTDNVDHLPIAFGSAFFCRNNSASAMTVSMVGSVPMSANRLQIRTLANNTAQETYFGFNSPVPESLVNLQIPAVAGDQIFGFDNTASGKNKGTVVTYGYTGSGWEDGDTGDPINATVKLQPGWGYVYRRVASPTPSSVVWQKLPSYLQ